MTRANVNSRVLDESAVIPAQEGSSSLIAGIIDPDGYPNNLLGSLGFTHEREQGYMTISSVGEWHERLKTNQPTGIGPYDTAINFSDTQSFESIPFIHLSNGGYIGGDIFSGGTFERWTFGSNYQRWDYLWNIIENYLQYGGQITIFGANSNTQSKADVVEVAKNKKIPLDVFISPFFLENNDVRNVVEYRQDCIAITSVPSENKAGIIVRPKNDPQGPSDPPSSPGFFRGTTYSLYEYDPTPSGFAEPEFDRAFLGNTGNTYRYEPGKLVYSVVVRDDRPRQEYLGSTTDVVNFERYRSTYEYETFSHYRGWTLDILGNSDCIALGATFSGGTNDTPSNGGVNWYNANAQINYTVNGIQQETVAEFPEEFINWQNHKKNNIRFYANPQFKTKMGETVVVWKCLNLEDNGVWKTLLNVTPTILTYPNANSFLPNLTYQTFLHIAVPSNWMDPFSYKLSSLSSVLSDSLFSKDVRQGISAFQFFALGGGTRSWELLPDPNDPNKTIRTGMPAADVQFIAPLSWSETRSSSMIDLRKTFDPNFDVLDNIYGPSGFDPNPELYDLYQEARSLIISGFASPSLDGTTFAPQTLSVKRNFNIFDSVQGPTSDTDANGNSPIDFWGCTCSRIPEFLTTFNIVGTTPDICIEVGPNSRTQDVTADGSTYTAYIGWSHPVPYVGIKSLVNIFGETIGSSSSDGSTLSNLLIKFNNTQDETVTCSDQYGNTESTQVKSIVFYPLVQNTSFDDESPIGPGNYPLKRDEENYFSVPVFKTDAFFSYYHDVTSVHGNAPHQDPNHALYESHFTNNLSTYVDTGYHEAAVQFNRMVNNTDAGALRTFIGSTLSSPSTINEVGNVGASYAELFYLGYSGSSLEGQGLPFDGYEGIYLVAEVDVVPGIPSFGFAPSDYDLDVADYTYNNIFSSNADLYEFPVFGEKYAVDSYEAYKSVDETQDISRSNEIPFTSDVAGMFARLFRDLSPWFSPANQRVSTVNDIIAERYNLSNAEQDDLYDNKINFIKQIDGAMKLWGDKTFANSTSTFSRVNVASLFIYLKKKIEPLGRRFLFEQNDAQSRELFRNGAEPFLQTLVGQRAITDFKVICDETNNTPDIVDSNQFVVEILIKPTKTINYIRLTMNNVGSTFELE
jgi:hypothetical protein